MFAKTDNRWRALLAPVSHQFKAFDLSKLVPHFIFGFFERFRVKISVLERRDDALFVAGDVRVKGFHLGLCLVGQRVLQLGDRRQQSGAVHSQLAVFFAQAELDGEEVALVSDF